MLVTCARSTLLWPSVYVLAFTLCALVRRSQGELASGSSECAAHYCNSNVTVHLKSGSHTYKKRQRVRFFLNQIFSSLSCAWGQINWERSPTLTNSFSPPDPAQHSAGLTGTGRTSAWRRRRRTNTAVIKTSLQVYSFNGFSCCWMWWYDLELGRPVQLDPGEAADAFSMLLRLHREMEEALWWRRQLSSSVSGLFSLHTSVCDATLRTFTAKTVLQRNLACDGES